MTATIGKLHLTTCQIAFNQSQHTNNQPQQNETYREYQKFVTDFKDALVEAENICFKEFEITKTKPEHHQLHFYQLLMSQSHDKESIICLSKNYFLQRRIPLQQAVVEVI